MTFAPANSATAFVPLFKNFNQDTEQLQLVLTQMYQEISNAINIRDIATYDLVELQNGQQFFTVGNAQKKRLGFRKVIPISDSNLSPSHGINGATIFTKIAGGAVSGANFIPLPYISASAVTDQIQIDVTATQVIVTKGSGAPAITEGYIILEYLKQI